MEKSRGEESRLGLCPDCGDVVSRIATWCPHCGRPLQYGEAEAITERAARKKLWRKEISYWMLMLAVAIGILIGFIVIALLFDVKIVGSATLGK